MIKGTLFVISAPSGAGKTSLVKKLMAQCSGLIVSVSHTTRAIRQGEVHGEDYYFTDPATFKSMLDEDAFLEHAQVFDNFYGTAKASVNQQLDQGMDVILEIDWQGAEQVRQQFKDCISIFILPPTISVLEERLKKRGQDTAEIIQRRMNEAINELSHYPEYDYLIVNDNFDIALNELSSIIKSQRLKQNQQKCRFSELIDELNKKDPF